MLSPRALRIRPLRLGAPLDPRPRRPGLGADTSLLSDPTIAGAWTEIEGQMQQEGAGSTAIALARTNFLDTLTGLTGPGGVLSQSSDAGKAVDAAKNLIVSGKTVLGAVQHIQGLLATAQGGDPKAVFQAFTGTMIGLATTAGVVTAGVGAAIAFGLSVALDFFQQLDLFGAAPKGVSLPGCPQNVTVSPTPTLQVGCVGMQGWKATSSSDTSGGAIQHGSVFWRTFPKGQGGNTNDAQWYDPNYRSGLYWSGSPNGPVYFWIAATNAPRLIDAAFPDWHVIACANAIPPQLVDFTKAFNQAWIANKEYELNGLKSQPDSVVFDHVVQIWNRAHDGSTYLEIRNMSKPDMGDWSFDAFGKLSWPCPKIVPALYQTLVTALLSQPSPDTPIGADGQSIRIHTGAAITPKKHLALHLGPVANASPLEKIGAEWQALPVGGKVAVATGGAIAAAGIGGSLYAFFTNQGIGYFWGKVFDKVIEGAKGLVGR